jgi:2-polyprenyl-3-methyl-5-hydroxy-6-metoxy-1,4-benzoquinol methylase
MVFARVSLTILHTSLYSAWEGTMSKGDYGILQNRRRAAELSGGISSDPIYSAIQRVIADRDLRGKILDYGAGVGQFVRRLLSLQRFEQIAAADILPVPADLVGKVEWIAQDLNLPILNHDEIFDAVIAAEVVEHLENPRAMMRDLFRVLRPGGTAIISTPNNESWRAIFSLLIRGHYVAFGDTSYPAHIVALLRKDFDRIFQEAQFHAPEFQYTDEGGLPGKPDVTWQAVTFGLLHGLRFSDNIIAVATKPR